MTESIFLLRRGMIATLLRRSLVRDPSCALRIGPIRLINTDRNHQFTSIHVLGPDPAARERRGPPRRSRAAG